MEIAFGKLEPGDCFSLDYNVTMVLMKLEASVTTKDGNGYNSVFVKGALKGRLLNIIFPDDVVYST